MKIGLNYHSWQEIVVFVVMVAVSAFIINEVFKAMK